MDYRHLIAYFLLLLIVAGLGAAWWRVTRDQRAHRRASREFDRRRARKAEEARGG